MTQINLLPWREQARRNKKIIFGLSILGSFGLGLMVVLVLHIGLSSMANIQKKRTNYLQAELDQLSGELVMLNKKKKDEMAVQAQLNYLVSLRETSYEAVQMLDELARIVPKNIQLNKITREGRRVTITGKAQSNASITLLMANLTKSDLFQQPDLTEISGQEAKSVKEPTFELKVEMARRGSP